jgi:ATP-dependent Clp protease ATP-binding subunit ClpB
MDDLLTQTYTDPIEKIIGDKIIGQKGPVRSAASAIRLRENGWADPDRPLVMLFLGSSGVGKTELAKQITYYLQKRSGNGKAGSQNKVIDDIEKSGAFVRIDMSEFQHSHTVSNLTGMFVSFLLVWILLCTHQYRFSEGLRRAFLC